MPTVTYELLWNCGQCGKQDIGGLTKLCPSCGHQQDHEERIEMERRFAEAIGDPGFKLPEDRVITDEATLQRVQGFDKADWWCNLCDKSVPHDLEVCDLCTAPEGATYEEVMSLSKFEAVRQLLRERGDERALLIEAEGAWGGREALAGRGAGDGLQDALSAFGVGGEPEESGSSTDEPGLLRGHRFFQNFRFPSFTQHQLMVAGGVLFVILLVLFLVWGFSTHEVPGQVSALTWSRSEVVERFTPVTNEDWRSGIHESSSRMPVNGSGEHAGAEITTCRKKEHHKERYQDGTKPETRYKTVHDPDKCGNVPVTKYKTVQDAPYCYTTPLNCGSGKNGTATCTGGDRVCDPRSHQEAYQDTEWKCTPQSHQEPYQVQVPVYKYRPIFADWCGYDTYEWQTHQRRTIGGSGHDLRWPELHLGSHDRRRRSGTYSVQLTWDDGGKLGSDTRSVNESKYLAWQVGEEVIVDVTNFGGAASIRRAPEPPPPLE
jgi:hypothetical protein